MHRFFAILALMAMLCGLSMSPAVAKQCPLDGECVCSETYEKGEDCSCAADCCKGDECRCEQDECACAD